ncbi:MAG: DUF692 domain-containing protein [Planctomycetaceae bacterium]|nr:DUF692 domain-containing protein [Planctomycetaceae bacterium]
MPATRQPYGVGLAYRPEVHHDIMQFRQEFDVMEVATVDYLERYWRLVQDPDTRYLRELIATFAVVAHGINMSIGSVEPHDDAYLHATRRFLDEYGIDEFSEHLAFHRIDGCDTRSFIAMPFEAESLNWLERKYNAARAILGRPFALENVSYLFVPAGCSLDEADFITEMTRRTDCSILLDATNVFNNAHNHGYDPITYIRKLPGDRINQLHIAGGKFVNGIWLDSHSATVMEPVWDLVHAALDHTNAQSIFLERDTGYHPFEQGIMSDIRKARDIFFKHRPATPPTAAATTPAPTAADEAPSRAINALDPAVANLRSFQRAIMRQITDVNFRQQVAADSNLVLKDYPMTPDWKSRWEGCNQDRLKRMAIKWPETIKVQKDLEEDLKRVEWRAWAAQNSW